MDMTHLRTISDDDPLAMLLKRAAKCEGAAEIKGEWNGLPFIIIGAVGASAGLMERYARQGTLRITPEQEQL
jgi:hypothetical protein